MGSAKAPARVIDGPYAHWACQDEQCWISLTASGVGNAIRIGQAVYLDVTKLGPDNNVPNNGLGPPSASIPDEGDPKGEFVVNATSGNIGPVFGVVTQVPVPVGLSFTLVNGVPTYTNNTGAALVVPLIVRQLGWGYVLVRTTPIPAASILVGATLIRNTTLIVVYATTGVATVGNTIGTVLATAINTYQATGFTPQSTTAANAISASTVAAPMGPGVVSIIPNSLVGIIPNALVLIDSPDSGVQEAVSVGSISYPTFSAALTNAHAAGFSITGPNTNPANHSVVISTPGPGGQVIALVAAWINVFV